QEAKFAPGPVRAFEAVRLDERGGDQDEPDRAHDAYDDADFAMQIGANAAEEERDGADDQAETLVARRLDLVVAGELLVQSARHSILSSNFRCLAGLAAPRAATPGACLA